MYDRIQQMQMEVVEMKSGLLPQRAHLFRNAIFFEKKSLWNGGHLTFKAISALKLTCGIFDKFWGATIG